MGGGGVGNYNPTFYPQPLSLALKDESPSWEDGKLLFDTKPKVSVVSPLFVSLSFSSAEVSVVSLLLDFFIKISFHSFLKVSLKLSPTLMPVLFITSSIRQLILESNSDLLEMMST